MLGVVQRCIQLRAAQLHKLAVLLGTPCSGTKTAVAKGIQDALAQDTLSAKCSSRYGKGSSMADTEVVRVVSIDMGIRNLAYAVLSTNSLTSTQSTVVQNEESGPHGTELSADECSSAQPNVCLEAWQKIDISSATIDTTNDALTHTSDDGIQAKAKGTDPPVAKARSSSKTKAVVAPYHPADYSLRAYTLIRDILMKHKPTHVIIERQRFRSGGGANVLEWTIRVGMFEGMLWAVLRTLIEQSRGNGDGEAKIGTRFSSLSRTEIEAILPVRVNRFWLEAKTELLSESDVTPKAEKVVAMKGREVKKAKIGIVSSILSAAGTSSVPDMNYALGDLKLELAAQAQTMGQNFQNEVGKPSATKRKTKLSKSTNDKLASAVDFSDTKISKLDDLADCLLQGLAWLQWKRNRNIFAKQGPDALLPEVSTTR